MNRSTLRKALPYVFSAAALLIFAVYVYRNIDRYRQLLDLSAKMLLALTSLALALLSLNGLSNFMLYRGLGVPLTLNEGIGLAAVNTLANQLPFAGGLIAKGVYLKQRYQLDYTRYLSATLALYVCFVAANGMIGIVVLALWAFRGETTTPVVLVLGFSAMAASILLLWLPITANTLPGRWRQRLLQLMDGWLVLNQNPSLTLALVGLQVLMTLVFAGRFWIAFRSLSQQVTFTQCILFSAATILTRLISIAPGGLGIREAIVVTVASVFGFDVGVSVMAGAIDRGVETAVVVALGTIFTYILSKKVSSTLPEAGPSEQ